MFGRPLFGVTCGRPESHCRGCSRDLAARPRWQDVVLPGCAIAELHEDLALTAEYSGLRREEAWRR